MSGSTAPDRLVFLDVDGVLARFESDAPFESTRVARLNEIVERTGASIVITSSWRERVSLDDLRDAFARAGFRGVIVGIRPILLGGSRRLYLEEPRQREARAAGGGRCGRVT